MALDEYLHALHQGQRETKTRIAAGLSPTLEVLDELLAENNINIATQQNLGLVNIPMENLVGTKTSGRQSAFTAGFLPILPADTEFADKWTNLCNIHLREGICVPIKAFEYKNKFYVEEGNKRVSVLKYFGALTVPATVTRLIPERQDTLESRIYYEFLDFYKHTGINYIWFTREGSFAALSTAVCKASNEMWSVEDKQDFYSFYHMFRPQFEALGGNELGLTPADAILVYLSLYRYSESIDATGPTILQNLQKIWNEITVLTERKAVKLSLEPQTIPADTPLLSKLWPVFSSKPDALRVVFVHERDSSTSGWTKNHAEGRKALEFAFPGQVVTSHIDHILPGIDDEATLEAVARSGADVIFTTSPPMMPACLKVAARHPEVKILNCSLNAPHPSVRTYYVRLHEIKYLLGMLAGILTPSNEIGYLAHYPIYGTPTSINAFALGVQAVRPSAKIILRWTCLPEQGQPFDFSDCKNVSIISGRDQLELENEQPIGNQDYGLCQRLPGGINDTIATPLWQWGTVYKELLRGILDGTWKNEETYTQQAINYWWGLQSNSMGIHYTSRIPEGSLAIVRMVEQQLRTNQFNVFQRAFYAQGHIFKAPTNGVFFTSEELLHMDYLLENIEGHIPKTDEMIQKAQRLVGFQGVACAKDE